MMSYNLTKNFDLSEFTKSQVAIRLNIKNNPGDEIIVNLKLLCEDILQPLREIYNKPIIINSGYRSKELNVAIGGSPTSQHCKGQAADIDTVFDNTKLFSIIKDNFEFDQLIAEFKDSYGPAWIHVSKKSSNNRKQILIATKENGKTVYLNYTNELFLNIYNEKT